MAPPRISRSTVPLLLTLTKYPTLPRLETNPFAMFGDGTDELQDEVRAAFSQSPFGQSVADRVGRRLLLVRSPDDLVDLAANLSLLLDKPKSKDETWQGHGRDR